MLFVPLTTNELNKRVKIIFNRPIIRMDYLLDHLHEERRLAEMRHEVCICGVRDESLMCGVQHEDCRHENFQIQLIVPISKEKWSLVK